VAYYASPFGVVATMDVITTCPHCSRLVDNSCIVCGPDDQHPSCQHCEGHIYKPPKPKPKPFYRSDVFISVMTAVAATVLSSAVLYQLNRIGMRTR
jgi:hypothetical protein